MGLTFYKPGRRTPGRRNGKKLNLKLKWFNISFRRPALPAQQTSTTSTGSGLGTGPGNGA